VPSSLPRTWLRAALLLAAGLGVAASASALDVALSRPRVRGSYVLLDARLSDLFDDRIRKSLTRGMPATIELHAELWRHRGGWFDHHEQSFVASVRIRYDVWDDIYRVDRPNAPTERFVAIDSLESYLSRPWGVPIARTERLQAGTRYYAVVTGTLRPVTVEDVNEVEGWIAGPGGLGVVTELPKALFDAVRNVAGFGDRTTQAMTGTFIPDTLRHR
jgi:hypothetical protein